MLWLHYLTSRAAETNIVFFSPNEFQYSSEAWMFDELWEAPDRAAQCRLAFRHTFLQNTCREKTDVKDIALESVLEGCNFTSYLVNLPAWWFILQVCVWEKSAMSLFVIHKLVWINHRSWIKHLISKIADEGFACGAVELVSITVKTCGGVNEQPEIYFLRDSSFSCCLYEVDSCSSNSPWTQIL